MWFPKISSSRSLCKVLVLYPAKNEEIYGIVPYQKIFMSYYSTLKRKLQVNMWVTSGSYVGHIWIVLWVMGQMGQQVQPTFNPVSYRFGHIHSYVAKIQIHNYACLVSVWNVVPAWNVWLWKHHDQVYACVKVTYSSINTR